MTPVPKDHLRAAMRARRSSLSLEERSRRAVPLLTAIYESPAWALARTVLVYAAARGEPPLSELVALARETGRTVVVPRVDGAGLVLHVWPAGQGLVRGAHGIAEPLASWDPVDPEDVDLALLPGLAFDGQGGRLGQGGGHYDRLLAHMPARGDLPRRVGVAWAFQLIPQVPMDEHDQRVDAVVTEEGWR